MRTRKRAAEEQAGEASVAGGGSVGGRLVVVVVGVMAVFVVVLLSTWPSHGKIVAEVSVMKTKPGSNYPRYPTKHGQTSQDHAQTTALTI